MKRSDPHIAVRPVKQARSRKTLHSLLDGLDRLLRDRPFEAITVLELSQAAKVSTGAFYARFTSKEDLLPELYQRYQSSLEKLIDRDLEPSTWKEYTAQDRIERLVQFVCGMYENRPWLLRAVSIHSRRRHSMDALPNATSSPQVRLLQKLADCVGVAPSPFADHAREQLEFAVYTTMTLAREVILFPNLPMATALGLNPDSIRQRLTFLLRRQLGTNARQA